MHAWMHVCMYKKHICVHTYIYIYYLFFSGGGSGTDLLLKATDWEDPSSQWNRSIPLSSEAIGKSISEAISKSIREAIRKTALRLAKQADRIAQFALVLQNKMDLQNYILSITSMRYCTPPSIVENILNTFDLTFPKYLTPVDKIYFGN